jgi:hypothetical protein
VEGLEERDGTREGNERMTREEGEGLEAGDQVIWRREHAGTVQSFSLASGLTVNVKWADGKTGTVGLDDLERA